MKKYLVCYGTNVVKLYKSGLTIEEAKLEHDKLSASGNVNVRIREEDPIHPMWPLQFDAEEEYAREKKEQARIKAMQNSPV